MAKQTEVLRLANECDTGYPLEEDAKKAAAELRRLHGLTRAFELAEALESDDSSVSCMEAAAAELRRLEAVNKQLLEALEKMVAIHDEPSGFAGKYGKALNAAIEQQKIKIDERLGIARAAIAAAKGEA